MKKKIISIFLLLIIIASQIGPAVIATEDTSMTLEQYLIKNGVDTDGDKKISDAEWAKVKNLYLDSDIKNVKEVEKAINLKSLNIDDTDGFNAIDFSKLQKLESLSISYSDEVKNLDFSKVSNTKNLKSLYINYNGDIKNLDFSKLIQLKELSIIGNGEENKNVIKLPAMQRLEDLHCRYIYDLDISELSNLGILEIRDCTNIKLPKFVKLKVLAIYGNFNIDGIIDLQSCEEIEGDIYSEIGIEKIKINENTMITKGSTYLRLENLEDEINIELNKNYELGNGRETYKLVKNDNDNVAIFNSYVSDDINYAEIKAKNVGTTNMTVKDILGREKTIRINVYERKKNNPDTKLENTGITAKFIDNLGTVLKSNGELWKVSSTTARKIDTNVKDFKSWFTYSVGDFGIPSMKYSKLDKDNTLTIKVTDTYEYTDKEVALRTIKNVKEIGSNMYLNTKGELFTISYNHITEEICTKKVRDHVKRILDYCIVLEDGTTWIQTDTRGTFEGAFDVGNDFHKITDFEVNSVGEYKVEEEKYYYCAVDMNNNLYGIEVGDYWKKGTFDNLVVNKEKIEMKLLKENFNNFYTMNVPYFSTQELYESNINYSNLSNVVAKCEVYDLYDILIRTDGTIWTYSDEDGLTKITDSTTIDEEDKDFLNPTAKIHEKELGNTSILYGISDSTKVEDFKKQNNFNSTYEVKIYDKNDKELQNNNIIGTGSKVKLYKQGKIVKEYTVILYGDTTGDGKITSVDALAIIKHINNKIPFTKEEYIEAGRVRKESGKNLTSVDALATVKSVNGKYEITKNK